MIGFELEARMNLVEQAAWESRQWSDGHCPKHGAFRAFPATQECHWCRCEAQERLLSSAPTPKRFRPNQPPAQEAREGSPGGMGMKTDVSEPTPEAGGI